MPDGHTMFSEKWPPGRRHGPPYQITYSSNREATYGNHGNHYQAARRREIGMDTRNEMCKGTEKGDK
ncbi:hypothetical protein BH18ACT11_BH18ACT11_22000 [soil metagenome]